MPNMSLKKHEMPSQEPQVRNKNFKEVALGYTAETAIEEAQRCLHCKHKPCIGGCPVKIHIPDFIAKVAVSRRALCLRYAAGYARRRRNASKNACAVSRASRLRSGGWNGLWRTGTTRTAAIFP